jgi:hypothetical protein
MEGGYLGRRTGSTGAQRVCLVRGPASAWRQGTRIFDSLDQDVPAEQFFALGSSLLFEAIRELAEQGYGFRQLNGSRPASVRCDLASRGRFGLPSSPRSKTKVVRPDVLKTVGPRGWIETRLCQSWSCHAPPAEVGNAKASSEGRPS